MDPPLEAMWAAARAEMGRREGLTAVRPGTVDRGTPAPSAARSGSPERPSERVNGRRSSRSVRGSSVPLSVVGPGWGTGGHSSASASAARTASRRGPGQRIAVGRRGPQGHPQGEPGSRRPPPPPRPGEARYTRTSSGAVGHLDGRFGQNLFGLLDSTDVPPEGDVDHRPGPASGRVGHGADVAIGDEPDGAVEGPYPGDPQAEVLDGAGDVVDGDGVADAELVLQGEQESRVGSRGPAFGPRTRWWPR